MTVRQGDRTRFSFSFFQLGTTTPVDPPVVQVLYRDPTGTETVYSLASNPTVVIRDSVGNYHADVKILLPRRHYFRAIGSGTPLDEKTTELFIDVPESSFTTPLP